MSEEDRELARRLQQQFDQEANSEMAPYLPPAYRTPQKGGQLSVVSDEWETIDPTPDLHALFIEFNKTFFWGHLVSCEVRWSPRMTQCAGICRYSPRERFCTIGISIPLLKLRPRKDLVETLLHEMIHAYLFVTDNNKDHDGHGPEFHKHMYRINKATGANISVYHTFHDEVALYKQHWWRCTGPCTKRPPFYGFVKRSMNRAPGPSDRWWAEHSNSCGGTFNKVKEPEGYGTKKGKENKKDGKAAGQKDIRTMLGSGGTQRPGPYQLPGSGGTQRPGPSKQPGSGSTQRPGPSRDPKGQSRKTPVSDGGQASPRKGGGGRGNIFGFGGTSFTSPGGGGGLKTAVKSGTVVVKPGWKVKDNSSAGSSINSRGTADEPSKSAPTAAPASSVASGQSLGGTAEQPTLSAREMARLRWADAFSGPSMASQPSSPTTTGWGSAFIPTSSTTSGRGSASQRASVTTSVINPSAPTPLEPHLPCPVCETRLPPDQINTHLDQCLANQGSPAPPEEEDLLFDDSDNDLLLQAAEEMDRTVDRSVISIGDDDVAVVVESDDEDDNRPLLNLGDSEEDDDEPLVKRRIMDISLEQDDRDLLAVFQEVGTDEGGEFACPVCGKLLPNKEMNRHLDQCVL